MPTVRPENTPEEDPMVPTVVLPLSHVPPVEALVSAVVKPVHTVSEPPIAGGAALTVTIAVT